MGLDIHAAALGGWVREFVRASNSMAGIRREPTAAEVAAHRGFLAAKSLRVENLELFVHHIAPGAGLRAGTDESGAEEGVKGDGLRVDLTTIVRAAETRSASPERLHRIYRQLRPFTDGNGRCGRALWMWQLMRGTVEELSRIAQLDLSDPRHPLNSDATLHDDLGEPA